MSIGVGGRLSQDWRTRARRLGCAIASARAQLAIGFTVLTALAGCGGGIATVEDSLEEEIKQRLEINDLSERPFDPPPGALQGAPRTPAEVDKVDCPDEAKVKSGSRFRCRTLDSEDQTSGNVEVEVLNDGGRIRWSFAEVETPERKRGREATEPGPGVELKLKPGYRNRGEPSFAVVRKVVLGNRSVRRSCRKARTSAGAFTGDVPSGVPEPEVIELTCDAMPIATFQLFRSPPELQGADPPVFGPGFRNGSVFVELDELGLDDEAASEALTGMPSRLREACRCGTVESG